jgi:hypothetical protein
VPERGELALRCGECGRAASVITIRSAPRLTIATCSECERRSWTVDGAEASIADVLAILHREPGLRARRHATSLT